MAIAEFVRRLKFYKPVRQSVDLDRLTDEFDRVTYQELDLLLEGRNAERFAQYFVDDTQICAPAIYWDYSTVRTLTMEDVGYITLDDLPSLSAAGIDPDQVAQVLARCTLEQTLVHYFVHADPHSGNLFVRPMLTTEEMAAGLAPFAPGVAAPFSENRPFQIAYVDFGMSVEVAPRLRTSMREYMIGVATGDAQRIVQSYVDGDMLLPGADIDRLVEMTEGLLARFGDSMLGQMQNIDIFEYNSFIMGEYRDLVDNPPLQFQSELLFVFRAMGLVSGITAKLSPDFDLWAESEPIVLRLLKEEVENNWQDWARELGTYGQIAARLPKQLDDLLDQAQRQRLTIMTKPDPESRNEQRQLRNTISQLTWMVAAAFLLLSGVLWRLGDQLAASLAGTEAPATMLTPSTILMATALIVFLWSLRRRR